MATNKELINQIDLLQKRNRFLEDCLARLSGKASDPVFVVVADGNVTGVHIDEDSAKDNARACSGFSKVNVEPWIIQGGETETGDDIIWIVGQNVNYFDKETRRIGNGTIISDDCDVSMGNKKLIYYILPDGMPFERANLINLFGEEINGLNK